MLKKISLFGLLTICSSLYAFENGNINIGVTNLNSETKEIVYDNGKKISELTWKTENIQLLNVGLEYNIKDRIFLSGDLKSNFTNNDMVMDDYDWSVANPNNEWSDWSHHDNTKVEDIKMLDVNAKYKFEILPIYFGIGYKYENFEYKAYDGKYIYSSNPGFRDLTGTFSGLGITYEHTLKMPYLMVGADLNVTKNLNIGADLAYSNLAKFEDKDIHHFRNLEFKGDFDYTDYLGASVYANYSFTKLISLGIVYNYSKYDTAKGDMSVTNLNSGNYTNYSDSAEIEHENQTITAKLKFKF